MQERFELLSEIRDTELIAEGVGVRDRRRLQRAHGQGRWRKLKGIANVRLTDGALFEVELHWYECHGIGRRELKIKDYIRRL